LGHKQYFVSSDVGTGKMQWYAFYNEAPGGVDSPNGIMFFRCLSSSEKSISSSENNARATQLYVWL
jgi:hypothetical protein